MLQRSDSLRREVLYDILIEFGVTMKLVRLFKIFLNETYSKFRIDKHLSDAFPIQHDLKQGYALLTLSFNFALEYAKREGPGKPGGTEMGHISC
jgi:hypothetical protein